MSAGVEVHVDEAELRRRLEELGKRAEDLSPAMQVCAEQMVAAVGDRWRSAGDWEWQDLAESTKRRRRGTSYQILMDTGRSIASVRGESGPDWAEAATDVATMVFHVSDEPRHIIPLRNPFELGDDVLDECVSTIEDYIAGDFAG